MNIKNIALIGGGLLLLAALARGKTQNLNTFGTTSTTTQAPASTIENVGGQKFEYINGEDWSAGTRKTTNSGTGLYGNRSTTITDLSGGWKKLEQDNLLSSMGDRLALLKKLGVNISGTAVNFMQSQAPAQTTYVRNTGKVYQSYNQAQYDAYQKKIGSQLSVVGVKTHEGAGYTSTKNASAKESFRATHGYAPRTTSEMKEAGML